MDVNESGSYDLGEPAPYLACSGELPAAAMYVPPTDDFLLGWFLASSGLSSGCVAVALLPDDGGPVLLDEADASTLELGTGCSL